MTTSAAAPAPDPATLASGPHPSAFPAVVRAFPFACLLGLFGVHFCLGIFVRGDSFQAYATFNSVYGNLLAAGELLQWLPYAAYGSPAQPYLQTFLGPFQYLGLLVGALCHVSDAWLLFSVSICLESFVLVGGAYLLASELYESEIAASAVATWVAVSLFWNTQIFWPHRALLFLPLLLYFTLRFHRTGDLRQVLRLGLSGVISLMGSLAYLAPIYAFLICLFFLLLRVLDRKAAFARLRRPGLEALPEGCLLALVVGLFAFLFLNQFHGATFTSPDRDPRTGAITLNVFLNFGGSALDKLPDFVLGHWVRHFEFFFYLGVVATGLTLFALSRVRTGVFLALAASCTVLFLLSLGPQGLVGYAVYWFPGMDRFRHLAFLLPMVRILLFLLAGFGLDQLLKKPREQRTDVLLWLAVGAVAILALKHAPSAIPPVAGWAGLVPEISCAMALAPCLWARAVAAKRPLALGLVLALAVAFELGSAHHLLQVGTRSFPLAPGRFPGEGIDVRAVQDFPFQPGRFTPQTVFAQARALRSLAVRQPVNNFALLHLVGADPCVPIFRIDYALPQVLELLEKAAPGALARSNQEIFPQRTLSAFHWSKALEQPWFLEDCGCDGGKLMLETPQGQRLDASGGVRNFSANRLVVAVDAGAQGGQLYYADAFHPGWKATVDGQAAAITPARGAFKAVAVPPGRHEVALAFYDPWRDGARGVLALAALLALGLLFARGVREQAERRSQP